MISNRKAIDIAAKTNVEGVAIVNKVNYVDTLMSVKGEKIKQLINKQGYK